MLGLKTHHANCSTGVLHHFASYRASLPARFLHAGLHASRYARYRNSRYTRASHKHAESTFLLEKPLPVMIMLMLKLS